MKLMQYIQYLFFGILSLLVIGAIVFGALIKNSLPKDNGELATSKISEEVLIYKDSWGIPHIEAQNKHDAIFAYGYTVAKDRLFQMDLQRRLSQGKLSELLGDDLVEIDIMFRTYLFKNWAENYLSSSHLSEESLSYVNAFVEGVNHFVETGEKPFEYYLLNANVESFSAVDVASMTAYMAFTLSLIHI